MKPDVFDFMRINEDDRKARRKFLAKLFEISEEKADEVETFIGNLEYELWLEGGN